MYKNELNMDQRPECKSYPINLLEEDLGEKLHVTEFGKDFLDMICKDKKKNR